MLVVLLPIFVADTIIINGYNFVAPLKVFFRTAVLLKLNLFKTEPLFRYQRAFRRIAFRGCF